MSIRCFMIEPMGVSRLYLRRYQSGDCPAEPKRGYHNAQTYLYDVAERLVQLEGHDRPVFQHDGPKTRDEVPEEFRGGWPTSCACGYPFADGDQWQVFSDTQYRRTDGQKGIISLRDTPAGAMWWLTWMSGLFHPQLGDSPLCVMTPGGEWVIDSRASNCTMPDDYNQERHHCWIAHGVPPNVTVDKNGVTCGAGAGSIQAGSYHGFLQNGELT